jgi:hypothetical protein
MHCPYDRCTGCCVQVKQLAVYLKQREAEGEPTFSYTQATVTRYGAHNDCSSNTAMPLPGPVTACTAQRGTAQHHMV